MTYHPCSAETSRKSGAVTYSEPLGPPWPVTGHLYFFFSRWGWKVNTMPWLLYPLEWPRTHCIGWVSHRASLDGCGKSQPMGIWSPDHPGRSESLHRLCYPSPPPLQQYWGPAHTPDNRMHSTPHIVKTSTQKYKLQNAGLKLVISPMPLTDYLSHFSDVSQVQTTTPHQKRFSDTKRRPFPTTVQCRSKQKVN